MYTPHTVTLYNVQYKTDPATLEDIVETNITILSGVFFDASKAVNVNRSGLTNADSVNLHVPFDVRATAANGMPKAYASPKAYENAVDKSGLWTLDATARCFFVKGVVVESGKDFDYINKTHDDVHVVTKVDLKDFGSREMWHFEVGGA